MSKHEWKDFSNPRNNRVKIEGCIRCGALKGSAAEKIGGKCVATSLEKNSLIRMGWIVVGAEKQADGIKTGVSDLARTAATGWSTLYNSKFNNDMGMETESPVAASNR